MESQGSASQTNPDSVLPTLRLPLWRRADIAVGDPPLLVLDRALQPVRRVLAFALRDLIGHIDHLRYVEVNLGRYLAATVALELPEPVSEALSIMRSHLMGFDAASREERMSRLQQLYQEIARIDAQLGLPLENRIRPPEPNVSRELEWEEISILPQEPETIAESPRDETEERSPRSIEPSSLGRNLTTLDAPSAILAALADEGVETVADLLQLAPHAVETLRPLYGAGRELPEERVAVSGRVQWRATVISSEGRQQFQVMLQGAGQLLATFDSLISPQLLEQCSPGRRIVLAGRHEGGKLIDAEWGVADGQVVHLVKYGLEGVDDRWLRSMILGFLGELDRLRDGLPPAMIERRKLMSLGEAWKEIHQRGPICEYARRRLAFDEALLLQIGLATPRFSGGRERGVVQTISHHLAMRWAQHNEWVSNDAQQAAFEDIKRDFRSNLPMLRVLTGQAGARKFAVAMLAAAMVAEGKNQVLFIAPDAATAERWFLFHEPCWRELGLVARLLVEEPSRAQRDSVRRGEVHIVFGSMELFHHDIEFRRLGLIVGEERPPYGRLPVRISNLRIPRPDVLLMGETPIPPAVLLSAFGDHDLSVIDRAPQVEIRTQAFHESDRDEAYRQANEAIDNGRQVYVVFPMVRSNRDEPLDVIDLREARSVVQAFEAEMFPGRRIGLFHGDMSREDRQRVWEDFIHRRCDVLICTTAIEDAPGTPTASVVVVEQADRIGVHRLMRLRGLVSRESPIPSDCLLIVGYRSEPKGQERAEKLALEDDDWVVAEWELSRRGLDDYLARDVAGGTRFRWLDPTVDRDLLVWGREEAHDILMDDPLLRRSAHAEIARNLRDRWEDLSAAPCPLPEIPGGKRRRRRRKRK